MRRLVLPLLILFLALPSAAQRRRAFTPTVPLEVPQIEQIASTALEHVPGVSIAVRKGNAYYAKSWGKLNVDTGELLQARSVFQIASVTKQFTAAAIMRLAEQGKLTVNDPIRRFIPELDSRFDPITLRHLLNHTSGIADYLGQIDTNYESRTQQEILALMMSRPPAFPAGAAWQYSNSGYYLLGIVIERASNQSYQQYLREQFFEPLQLHDTSYCGETGPPPEGYGVDSHNGVFFEYPPMDMSLLFSAGALCSTAHDLARWNRALTTGVAVSPASYDAMIGQSFEAYINTQYGFGLLIDTLSGHRRIWHNGLIFGFQSHIAYFPDDDVTVVVLMNFYGLRDRARDTAEAVSKAMLTQSPLPAARGEGQGEGLFSGDGAAPHPSPLPGAGRGDLVAQSR